MEGDGSAAVALETEEPLNAVEEKAQLLELPDPGGPSCCSVDQGSFILEWPEYFFPGSYCLEMAFSKPKALNNKIQKNARSRKLHVEAEAGLGFSFSRAYCLECHSFFADLSSCLKGGDHEFPVSSNQHLDQIEWVSIYTGKDRTYRVENLKPGMGYLFRIRIMPETFDSLPSFPTSKERIVFTPPSAPGEVTSPLLVDRGRTSLKVRWSPPEVSGGMLVSTYLMEMKPPPGKDIDEEAGHYKDFAQVYVGKETSLKVTRLVPGTEYLFRVAAVNCLGQSKYSKAAVFVTSPSVPAAPLPPEPVTCSATSITIKWKEPRCFGSPVVSYTLEIDDGNRGSYNVIYTGESLSHTVSQLRSGCTYLFRVLACNGIGKSAFSLPAEIATSHLPPKPPHSFIISGRGQTNCTISWEAPEDNGGCPIIGYELEYRKSMESSWTLAYDGPCSMHNLTGLVPGVCYLVHALAKNILGKSGYSSEASFRTLAGPPGTPSCPTCTDCQATALTISWHPPAHDGGSSILEYRLEMRNLDVRRVEQNLGSEIDVHDGMRIFHVVQTCHVVNGLSPGFECAFRVQAINKAGSSSWSSVSRITTAAAEPSVPHPPSVIGKPTANDVSLRWEAPSCNGDCITSYCLRMTNLGYGPPSAHRDWSVLCSGGSVGALGIDMEEPMLKSIASSQYLVVYKGPNTSFTARKLEPYTAYAFSVEALNSIGTSQPSEVMLVMTSSSAPDAPPPPTLVMSSTDTLVVEWEPPVRDNGSEVDYFTLEMEDRSCNRKKEDYNADISSVTSIKRRPKGGSMKGDSGSEWKQIYNGPSCRHVVQGLLPGMQYRLRVIAHNQHGYSVHSRELLGMTVATIPSAPSLPIFICLAPTVVRVKWSAPAFENGAPIVSYKLFMDNGSGDELHKVYEGMSTCHKVGKLIPGKTYKAAVQAINSVGGSEFSETAFITLPFGPLPTPEAPKVVPLSKNSVCILWSDSIEKSALSQIKSYILEMVYVADNKPIKIYEGLEKRYELKNLSVNGTYKFRICVNGPSDTGSSSWSSSTTFTMSSSEPTITAMLSKRIPDFISIFSVQVKYEWKRLRTPWSVQIRRFVSAVAILVTSMAAFYNHR